MDVDTGEIVGMAKWNIYQGTGPDASKIQGSSGDYWDTAADKEYYQQMVPIFLLKRNAAIERTSAKLASLGMYMTQIVPGCEAHIYGLRYTGH